MLISCLLAGSNDGAQQRGLMGRSPDREVVMEMGGGTKILASTSFCGCLAAGTGGALRKSHDSELFL